MSTLLSNLTKLVSELRVKTPEEIISFALTQVENIACAFSGAEDVVLIDMAVKTGKLVHVFILDTARLHAETYLFLERVRKYYGQAINMEILFPESARVQDLIQKKGFFSFYQDGHTECCRVRKVEPLQRKLQMLDAWITGQRRDQSNETRSTLEVIETDMNFSTQTHTLIKFNPLALWTSAQVWDYIITHHIPYNDLHTRGYKSIGCEPCTQPIHPGQHEREGRWWWESTASKECGLHQDKNKQKEVELPREKVM